jgi:hypothetical protein
MRKCAPAGRRSVIPQVRPATTRVEGQEDMSSAEGTIFVISIIIAIAWRIHRR